MKGLDFFMACYRNGVYLPVCIFIGGTHPNVYRPNALSFCNLTLDEDDEIIPEKFSLLEGFDVSIISESLDDKARELTKAIAACRPKHLMVCSGDKLLSWAPGRGWK